MKRALAVIATCVVGMAAASAQDRPAEAPPKAAEAPPPPKPMTEDEAIAAVLEAWKSKDEARLKELASRDDPDPWIVADELCARGEHESAEGFARAAARKDTERLVEYVTSLRGSRPDPALRKAVHALESASAAGSPAGAADLPPEGAGTSSAAPVLAVRLALLRGRALSGKRPGEALPAFRTAADLARRCGWTRGLAEALDRGGESAYGNSDLPEALEMSRELLAVEEARGGSRGVAESLGRIGLVLDDLGRTREALEFQEKSLRAFEAMGDRGGTASALTNLGVSHGHLGEHARALELHRRALAIQEEIGDRTDAASSLSRIGVVLQDLGELAQALEHYERSLKLSEEARDRRGSARALGNIGALYQTLGEYERAIGYHEKALRANEEIGDRLGVAINLGNIGDAYNYLGQPGRALEFLERSLKVKEELGDVRGAAATCTNLGLLYVVLGKHAEALASYEKALRAAEGMGDTDIAAATLVNMGLLHRKMGEPARALEAYERALRYDEESGNRTGAASTLANLAVLLRLTKRPAEGLARAHASVEHAFDAASGLGERLGTTARATWGKASWTGVLCAADLDDVREAAFFLESGRAASMIESAQAGKEAAADAGVDGAMAEEEGLRQVEARAAVALRSAEEAGEDARVTEAKQRLAAARKDLEDAVVRNQRATARAAGVNRPRPDDLDAIRARLGPSEWMVLFGVFDKDAYAVVASAGGARLVRLPSPARIREVCAAAIPGEGSGDAEAALAALRSAVVEPLALPPEARRVYVSPDADLCFVPFGALLEDREVACIPSATIHGILRADRDVRGESVLALGDPRYRERRGAITVASLRSGRDLASLPGTGEEAEAVGDTVLLRERATERGLREALRGSRRWRSVHLACHGLVDTERPEQSCLALTPDDSEDGLLTAQDASRLRCSADLVVLSACETGRGTVVRGEGLVGLTRAFMLAGAPRVLVSLWKVDDEATKALMVKFYELWNPKDGSKGLGAAAALKKAQEFVAGQEKWKHPRYWAAWVLWGLPE